MGRQTDWERLALGRSAFQEVETDGGVLDQRVDRDAGSIAQDDRDVDGYQQQYDSKGRPVNPATEAQNQAMRNAQNAVLKIVGVVESKEASKCQVGTPGSSKREAREILLNAEQDRGKDLGLITSLVHLAITWWPETLTSRIQAGVYPETMSFADVALRDVSAAQLSGSREFFDTFFAGAPLTILIGVLKLLLCGATIQACGRFQKWLNKRLQASTFKWANRILLATNVFGIMAIESALIPLRYFATTQRLGLAPSWPMLSAWNDLLPWNTLSTQRFIWNSTVDLPFAGVFSSPAALLCFQTVLIPGHDESTLAINEIITFRHLLRSESYLNWSRPGLNRISFGRLLNHGNPLRIQIIHEVLTWLGWNLDYSDETSRAAKEYENSHIQGHPSASNHDQGQSLTNYRGDGLQQLYRSTSMSQLPAQYLVDLLDHLYSRFRSLPLDSLVLRSIAFSFLASSLPKTPQVVSTATHIYSPFGGGPLGVFRAHGLSTNAWQQFGHYMSKLCLSLALQSTAEIGFFFALYKLTRWQGIRNFDWGRSRIRNTVPNEMDVDGLAESNP